MARPRLFDEDQALEAAMLAFWSKGYEATSTEELCAATGLGRGSIYNTFHSKGGLFARSLARYMELKDSAMEEVLAGEAPIREKVRTLLGQVIEPDPGEPAGCLVVNSMVELAPVDPAIATALNRDYQRRWRALDAAFAKSRRAGEIEKAKRPADLAHVVIGTITALRVMAQAGANRTALEAVSKATLAAI
jgi:AcrR family transcriptional regulator